MTGFLWWWKASFDNSSALEHGRYDLCGDSSSLVGIRDFKPASLRGTWAFKLDTDTQRVIKNDPLEILGSLFCLIAFWPFRRVFERIMSQTNFYSHFLPLSVASKAKVLPNHFLFPSHSSTLIFCLQALYVRDSTHDEFKVLGSLEGNKKLLYTEDIVYPSKEK